MNETNELELEIRLRAWLPRRPSARHKKILFANRRTGRRAITPHFAWLVPAAACLLLATIGWHADSFSRYATASGQSPIVAMVLSNQSFASYLPGNSQNDQNTLRNTFEWTNASRYSPSIRSFVQ